MNVRRFIFARIEIRAGSQFHQVQVTDFAARDQCQRPRGQGAHVGPQSPDTLVLRTITEVDLQRAADDRLYAGCGELVRELQSAKEVAGVGQPQSREVVAHGQFGQPRDRDRALQERVGRMHLEMHISVPGGTC